MRVLVLGAGYAGLTLARCLERRLPAGADLVVVNDRPTHLVQHELHRAIRQPALESVIEVPLSDVLDRAELVVDRVEGVDRERRRVDLADGGELSYDLAAICLGAETAFYGVPGLADHATPLKRLPHAAQIREAFLAACERDGRAVVGGAGLSGVQVAGELAALSRERDADVDVVLLEQLEAVAPSFPEPFQDAVRRALEDRGVDVRTGTTVTGATETTVEIEASAPIGSVDGQGAAEGGAPDGGAGDSLAYDALVWTGGIAGGGAMGGSRPAVRGDLRLDRATFAVGDAARVVDADGEAVPASASAAIREALTVADNVVRLATESDGDGWEPRMEPYRFDVPGWIVSIGDGAVAQVGPTVLTGAAATAMKATVGAGHLTAVGDVRRAVELVESELDG